MPGGIHGHELGPVQRRWAGKDARRESALAPVRSGRLPLGSRSLRGWSERLALAAPQRNWTVDLGSFANKAGAQRTLANER